MMAIVGFATFSPHIRPHRRRFQTANIVARHLVRAQDYRNCSFAGGSVGCTPWLHSSASEVAKDRVYGDDDELKRTPD